MMLSKSYLTRRCDWKRRFFLNKSLHTDFPLYCFFNRDPYVMVYYNPHIYIYNWVGCHPLYQTTTPKDFSLLTKPSQNSPVRFSGSRPHGCRDSISPVGCCAISLLYTSYPAWDFRTVGPTNSLTFSRVFPKGCHGMVFPYIWLIFMVPSGNLT